jgi:hypothetical protein
MDETALLAQLEEIAHRLSIKIRYETIKKGDFVTTGGLCRINAEHVLIINSRASAHTKVRTIAEALNRFDLTHMYIKPALREFLATLSTP